MVFAAELLGNIWLVREGALDNDQNVIRQMTGEERHVCVCRFVLLTYHVLHSCHIRDHPAALALEKLLLN